ncbi:N-acetylmuramoyl-L-alanine amidase [Virgibacillus byunsanensis]|uniref:N-acetylmuramoyl-L-alanine amidase n=1 Tax=Virgibacillus byunsanensis TaxID=570945 RepID=A0ABW3LL14_9BACI
MKLIQIITVGVGFLLVFISTAFTLAESEQNKNTKSPLEGYNIVLDPGHGGKDPGAIGLGGVHEKDFIMPTTYKVAQHLRDAGATVILTRTADYFVPLGERIRISNSYNTDAFISLHYNTFPTYTVNGISTFYYTNGNDRKLAHEIQSSLAANVPLKNRGIMQGDYRVLRKNSDLAVLLELGFITNPDDLSTVQTLEFQNGVAEGIVEGLRSYFSK